MPMQKLDMSKYHPYKKLPNNLSTRRIDDKHITWPHYKHFFDNNKTCHRLLESKDIETVSKLWRECYGELYGSTMSESWVLYPETYKEHVLLGDHYDDNSEDNDFLMLVFENIPEKKIWGAWVFWKDDNNLQIDFGFGFLHPSVRQNHSNFETNLQDFFNILENDSGAEYFTVSCETFQSKTQFLCFKKWGFKLGGIFPGETTRWNGDQAEYRACIVNFYKFKSGTDKYIPPPDEWDLLPEFQKVWNSLEEINK